MGLSGISVTSLVLILLIVILIFGTKKLKNIGKDLGEGVKSFRKGMEDNPEEKNDKKSSHEMSKNDDD